MLQPRRGPGAARVRRTGDPAKPLGGDRADPGLIAGPAHPGRAPRPRVRRALRAVRHSRPSTSNSRWAAGSSDPLGSAGSSRASADAPRGASAASSCPASAASRRSCAPVSARQRSPRSYPLARGTCSTSSSRIAPCRPRTPRGSRRRRRCRPSRPAGAHAVIGRARRSTRTDTGLPTSSPEQLAELPLATDHPQRVGDDGLGAVPRVARDRLRLEPGERRRDGRDGGDVRGDHLRGGDHLDRRDDVAHDLDSFTNGIERRAGRASASWPKSKYC